MVCLLVIDTCLKPVILYLLWVQRFCTHTKGAYSPLGIQCGSNSNIQGKFDKIPLVEPDKKLHPSLVAMKSPTK